MVVNYCGWLLVSMLLCLPLGAQAAVSAGSSKYQAPATDTIQSSLRHLLPGESIHVAWLNRAIALSGTVSTVEIAEKALSIARQYVDPRADVLNLMQVRLGQQVMLRVRIAEVRRHALEQAKQSLSTGKHAGQDLARVLDGLSAKGLLRMIAEPNLVAISGQEAVFVAGNEMPVRGKDGAVEYKRYGTKVVFTPYVMAPDRVRLHVEPEISYIDAVAPEARKGKMAETLPHFASHKASTTIEMAPGETFMIAGLVTEKLVSRGPCLGFVCSADHQDVELVIAVTPYLVNPMTGLELRVPTSKLHVASALQRVAHEQLLGVAAEQASLNKEVPVSSKSTKPNRSGRRRHEVTSLQPSVPALPDDVTLEGPVGYALP